ncbi:unnamed protein product [Cladocopium goreaui]|uniref:7,8-didemethyl-8-hydroxy-5-deazariboflavin synthase n=1 Tax=Cladocopium goreaui TaxID=2562237 RepID=A0A9P1DP97_9DINO|nr:unnamed protein product [Cladocopium goreaui]
MPSAWAPVKELSDDESNSHREDFRELGLRPKRKRKKRHGPTLRERLASEVHCRALLTKRCKGCRRPCLMGFASRQNGAFANLLDFRRKWVDTHKLDQDRVVFDSMKAALAARATDQAAVSWRFNGSKVCLRGWKALHAIGNGRFQRLWEAAVRGDENPPADMRFVTHEKAHVTADSSVGQVTTFLQTLYDSVAETLPDVKDDGLELSFHKGLEGADPYASVDMPAVATVEPPAKKQKVRKVRQGLKIHVERKLDHALEARYLPPGCMKDYFEQFKSVDVLNKTSFSTFWRVWRIEFDHLRFRAVSSHAQCSTCLHHRVLLKELSGYLFARQRQAQLYHAHLMSQYRDRQVYWALRSSSRLRTLGQITIIQDGMDQCKFAFPRSPLCRGKDLSTLIRPKLSIVGCLAHGWCLLFSVSDPTHPKDSSCMAELFCHTLTRLSRLGILAGASLQHLRSGHSHEDIDQTFGSLSLFLVKHGKQVETPKDFRHLIQKFCSTAHRPFENERAVVLLDQHRPWRDFLAGAVPVMLQGIGGPGAPHFFGISRREDLGS